MVILCEILPTPIALLWSLFWGHISLQVTMGYRGTNMVSDICSCLHSVILIRVAWQRDLQPSCFFWGFLFSWQRQKMVDIWSSALSSLLGLQLYAVNASYIQSTLQNVFIVITDHLLMSYRTCRAYRTYGSATTERDNVPQVPHLSKELLHQTVSPAIV